MIRVVHFTVGATDPVQEFCAHGVTVVPLADGAGADETYVSCLHFEPGGWIADPPAIRDSAILVVHGHVKLLSLEPTMRLNLLCGTGVVINADQRYRLESDTGGIIMIVEAECLEATERGLSTPERIWGQRWPDERDLPRPRTLISLMTCIYYGVRGWRPVQRLFGIDFSGWWPKPGGNTRMERFSRRARNPRAR
jgi:hypothetical protein